MMLADSTGNNDKQLKHAYVKWFFYRPHCDGSCDGERALDYGRVATGIFYCEVNLFLPTAKYLLFINYVDNNTVGGHQRWGDSFSKSKYICQAKEAYGGVLFLRESRWHIGLWVD